MGIFKTRKLHRILILGTQGSGKTTLIQRLSNQPLPLTIPPTVASELTKEIITTHKFVFSEQKQVSECSAIIYIVSYTDFDAGLTNLKNLFTNQTCPILVLLNKQDQFKNTSVADQCEQVANILTPLALNHSWGVRSISALENTNVEGVVSWFETQLPVY